MAAFVLISMGRVHAVLPFVALIRPGVLVAAAALILFLADRVRARRLRTLRHPILLLAGFFVFWAALWAPFGLYPGQSVRFVLGDFLRVLVLFILVAACVRNLHDVRRLLMTLAIGGIVFAVFAALPAGLRGVGGGGYDPNDSAMFLAGVLPLAIYFATQERRGALKLLFLLGSVVLVIAIVRTGSRGGFLAFGAVTIYILVFFQAIRPLWRVLSVAGIIGVLSLAATSDYWELMQTINDPDDYNHTSPTGRKAIWERARGYMAEHPITGVGIANFSYAESQHPMIAERIAGGRGFKYSAAHSMWYQVGAETGFPGLIAFAGIFLLSFFYLFRVARFGRAARAPPYLREAGDYALALMGLLIAIIVAGSLLSNAYWGMVWGSFALVLGLLKALRLKGVDMAGKGYRKDYRMAMNRDITTSTENGSFATAPPRWRPCVERLAPAPNALSPR